VVYPRRGGLAAAGPAEPDAVRAALGRLRAGGGTKISTWLDAAADVLADEPGVRHVLLLTDGKNGESAAAVEKVLGRLRGQVCCDARGVGTDWSVEGLWAICDALLGEADIVEEPAGLAADFTALVHRVMGRRTADVALRVWTPVGARVLSLQQMAPHLADLRGDPSPEARAVDYVTGAWGEETREYHLRLEVPAGVPGEEMLAARVRVVVGGEPVAKALVRAVWTDDVELSTRVPHAVAHYTGQVEMVGAIQTGLAARDRGEVDAAEAALGRAAALAHQAGNTGTLHQLARVVDIEDAPTGRVRLRPQATVADAMTLETRSTRMVRRT
jgi:hypothetical protein